MNCIEARREFVSFWRRTMSLASRAIFVEHLRGCAQCDRAFRAFALTAPVVHSETAPVAPRSPHALGRTRRFTAAGAVRTAVRTRGEAWQVRKIAAAAAIFLTVGGLSAWSVSRWPAENFAESFAGEISDVDPVIYSADGAGNSGETLESAEGSPSDFIASEPSATDSDDGPATDGFGGQDSL
jgi:hypothetical protein